MQVDESMYGSEFAKKDGSAEEEGGFPRNKRSWADSRPVESKRNELLSAQNLKSKQVEFDESQTELRL